MSAKGGAAVCRAGLFQFAAHQQFTNGPIQSRALFWCKSGRGEIVVDGVRHSFEPHDLCLLPWNRHITYLPASRDPMFTAHVHLVPWYREGAPWIPTVPHKADDPVFDSPDRRDVDWLGRPGVVHLHARSDESIGRLIDYAVRWYRESKRGEPEARALGLLFVQEIVRAASAVVDPLASKPEELRRLMVHIETSYHRSPSIEELAGIIARSPSHVLKLFRRHLGVSAKGYLIGRQLQEARELLISTTRPVSEVASKVGFADPYHFSKLFHRHVGVSPRQYRHTHGPFASNTKV